MGAQTSGTGVGSLIVFDLVLDIFAGSNTTGAVAESGSRRWIAFEKQQDYLAASAFRFISENSENEIKAIYERLRRKGARNIVLPQQIQKNCNCIRNLSS